jgi:hypothetical protein
LVNSTQFEASWAAESVIFKGDSTDEEADAATVRVREVAQKIVALPATDMATLRLKARVYLWSESTDFATFSAENEGKGWSESVLVSLFRDLGVDRADAVLAIVAKLRATWHRLGKVLEEMEEGPLVDEVQGVLDAAKAELLETPRPHWPAHGRPSRGWPNMTSPTFQKRATNISRRSCAHRSSPKRRSAHEHRP